MSKKIMLGLNTFNSDTKISNSNWENRTSEPVWLEQGDTIALKSSFIDTRNRVSGNIILDQDTTIELSYYFYYINRGGTTIKSRVLDSPIVPPATTPPTQLFPNRQQLVQEYYNPTNDYTKDPGIVTIPPTGVAFTTPVANNSTDKIPDNLAPLAESIYHTYGPDKVKNWVVTRPAIPLNEAKEGILYQITDKAETTDADFNSIGCPTPIYNSRVFKATKDGTGIGTNPNPEINFTDISGVSTAYTIDNPGKPFIGGFDTDWAYVGYDLKNYPSNLNFTTPGAFPGGNLPNTAFIQIVNDITSIVEGISYTINTTTDYIDWTLYGAPGFPANTNPVLQIYTDNASLQAGQNYSIVDKGVPFKDGYDTNWVNLGATSPDNITFQFQPSTIPSPFNFPFISLDTADDILDLKIGMRLYVQIPETIDITTTFNNWELLGAPLPAPILASQNFPNSFKATIVNLGVPLNYNGYIYDTNWSFLGDGNPNPSVGDIYSVNVGVDPTPINVDNDFLAIKNGVSYTITETDQGIDWSIYGATPSTTIGDVIPVSQAVVGTIYQIVDYGFAYNGGANYPGTDTNFFNIGAIMQTPKVTRFLCEQILEPDYITEYIGQAENVLTGMGITMNERGQRTGGAVVINASAGTQGVNYQVVNIGLIVNPTLPNVTDTAWDGAGYTQLPPVVGGTFTFAPPKYASFSLEEAFEYTATYDDQLLTDTQDNLVAYQGQLIIVVNIGTMPLSDWVLLDPTLTAIPPVGYVFNLPVASTTNETNNGITTTTINAIPTLSVNDMVFNLLTPYTQFNTGVTFTIETNNSGIDWTHYGASDNNVGTTFTITNVPTSDDFKTTAIATAPVFSDITITPTGTISIVDGEFFDWTPYGGPNITAAMPVSFTATADFAGLTGDDIPIGFNLSITPTATIQAVNAYENFTFTANQDVTEKPTTRNGDPSFLMNVNSTGTIQTPFIGGDNVDFIITQLPSTSDINPTFGVPPTYIYPTGTIQLTTSYEVPFTFTATSTGTYAPYDNQGVNRLNLTYTANVIPTGSVQDAYEIAQITEVTLDDNNYILANNPVGFNNTQDVNQADGLPYLLTYSVPKNIDGSTNFDPSILDPGDLVPFIKKWKMTLKAGSYSPDYMAEIISRGMSVQKTKINTTSTITTARNSFLGTPNQGIHSQMYRSPDLSYLINWDSAQINSQQNDGTTKNPATGYFGYSARDCKQGPFPYTSQIEPQIATPPQIYQAVVVNDSALSTDVDLNRELLPTTGYVPMPPSKYQPQLFFNSKNKNIMPGYNGNSTTLPTALPVNPKYTDLDFNNPDSDYADDNPFVYRPNAFTHVDKNQTQGNVRLIYNDYNLNNYNDMPVFGNTIDNNIKCIEMMYRPLINDVDSSYYNNIQEKFGLPVTKQYSIRPVISASVASSSTTAVVDGTALPGTDMPAFSVSLQEDQGPESITIADYNADAVGYSAPCDISTPVVGANLMSLTYNNENNGLFEFPYMHTPIYTKPLTTGTSLQEVTAMYPSTITTYSGEAGPDSKINWSSYIGASTTFKEQSIAVSNTSPNPPLFTGAYYQNYKYYLDTFDIIASSTDTTQPGYFVYSGALFPGGVDGLNDLIINVLTWGTDPTSGEITPETISVSGIAPSGTSSQTFQTNSNVIQIGSQSGIIFKDMIATKADGTSMPFWEQLGFDVPNITHKYDPKNPNDFTLKYETFRKSTTTGFQGTSTIFDPETLASGTTEMSYVSYVDSLNMLGWYVPTTANIQPTGLGWVAVGGNTSTSFFPPNCPLNAMSQNVIAGGGDENDVLQSFFQSAIFQGNFVLQNKILYSAVETTISLGAKIVFSDFTDTGHALVSIEGYNGSVLLTNNDKLNVKSLVSTYYTGPNAFITNSLSDSAIYEHVGMPMKLQNFKTRILSPYTQKELTNLGPNSSIYLEITKTINKDNATNITFDN